MTRVYLSGAMRGRPLYNWPLFQHWAYRLRKVGFDVVSPAEMDQEMGMDPELPTDQQGFTNRGFIERDIPAVLDADVLGLLPDYQGSVGTAAEIAIARWAEKPVIDVAVLESYTAYGLQALERYKAC